MFNYVKETIINNLDNVIKDGSTVVVKRGGNYDCTKICDAKVFKTVGVAGSVGTITIDPSKFTNDANIDFRQIAIFIGASEKLSDYALANWQEFGKPILIETAKTSASNLVETIKLALPNDNPLFTVEESSSKVLLTLAESWMIPTECKIFEHYKNNDTILENKTANLVTVVPNVPEFATAKWLVENLRFPSYPNIRYNALYSDEAPIRGTVYTQYSFQYVVKHSVPGGLSAVGQVVDSITTHVFYVPSASASTFESKFTGVSFVTATSEVSSMDPSANAIAGVSAEIANVAANTSATGTATSAPTTSTAGKVGDTVIYDGDVYTLTAIDTSGDTPSYTWAKTYDAA